MTKAPQRELIGAKYMSRFRCLMGDCEDSCCFHWKISVDKKQYKKIKQLLSKTPEDRIIFKQAVSRDRSASANESKFAVLNHDEKTGGCRFLDDALHCSLHRDYGEGALPLVCALYPRQIIVKGNRSELYGKLSCPEVARLCLLSDDGLELVEMSAHTAHIWPRHATRQLSPDNTYESYFDDVRAFVLQLLVDTHYSLSEKMFFTAQLAKYLTQFYFEGCQGNLDEQFREVFANFQNPVQLKEYKKAYHQLPEAEIGTFNSTLVFLAKGYELAKRSSPTFKALIHRSFDPHCQSFDEQNLSACLPQLWEEYQKLSTKLPEAMRQRLNHYFLNYSLNLWLSDPFVRSKNLMVFVQLWALNVATMKILITFHPRFNEVKQLWEKKPELAREELDDLAVECIYRFSRGIESNPAYMERIRALLDKEILEGLAQSILLLKL